jgi:hypothetical protein
MRAEFVRWVHSRCVGKHITNGMKVLVCLVWRVCLEQFADTQQPYSFSNKDGGKDRSGEQLWSRYS